MCFVYDVGVFNGDDTAYYLRKGHRVVGIEANPQIVPHLKERFSAEIGDGRLILLNVAISDKEGEASFWVCDDNPALSSFDRSVASYGDANHHQIMVPTMRLSSVFQRYGTPLYCKIDIEGSDYLCLEGMSEAPDYISFEVQDDAGYTIIPRLRNLGYTRFKFISQVSLCQPSWIRRSRRRDGDWRFSVESSGPFGEDTHGRWLNAEQAISRSLQMRRRQPVGWYDLHAAVDFPQLSIPH